MNESRLLRERLASASDAFDAAQAGGDAYGSAAMLAVTTTVATYPTAAAAFYACNPADLDGTEAEGQAAGVVPDTGTVVYALNLGASVPSPGTVIVLHACGGRWCFAFNG